MGRYTGPTERLSRRAGVELELKGERRMARKSGLDRRAHPPGDHGHRSGRRKSTYGAPARGQAGRQALLRRARAPVPALRARGAARRRARTGERLLQLLELRLDNVLTRLGFAATRAQARQFAVHGHVEVNGRRVDIPSAQRVPRRRDRDQGRQPVRPAAELATELTERVAPWLLADTDGARRARPARAGARRDPGSDRGAADRRVLQPRVNAVFAPAALRPARHHAAARRTPELALSLAWTFDDLDAAVLDEELDRALCCSRRRPARTRSTS